jgi:hypothetical protein
MGLFSGIEQAKVGQGGVYFLEGLYKIEILRVFTMHSRKGDDLFIVETKILESDQAERRVGTTCSWVVNLKMDPAMGNIKGFIAAANGIDPNNKDKVDAEVTEEAAEFVVSEENPLKGIVMGLEAVPIKTRAGGDFTLHKWQMVAEAA